MSDSVSIKGRDGGSKYMLVNQAGTLADPYKVVADVYLQDQTTPPVDFFFSKIEGTPTTVAVATAVDVYDVELTSAAGCGVGDYFGMFNADDHLNNRAFFASILAVNTNTLTLDTPTDFEFQIGDTAACFSRDINEANGSVTPVIYQVEVGAAATQTIDITRIMISFLTDSAVNLAKFGDLDALTRGCVLRRVNGVTHNIWNVKSNGEIANLAFDYEPYTTVNPAQGQNGAKFRYSFSGQDKHGVAVRLAPGDALQFIVQDDLTDLQQLRIIAEGHYVD